MSLMKTLGTAPAALVLHDVAPATLSRCQALLKALEPMVRPHGPMPVTHLVVPHYHGGTRVTEDVAFRRWLDARVALGDEVVLHGFRHADDQPIRGLGDRLLRRFYTVEGEFATLDRLAAEQAITEGKAMLEACDWSSKGFVAPAWLMSPAVRAVLPELGFSWTATRTGLIDLVSGDEHEATSLVWSVRAPWRRWMSARYNGWLLDRLMQPVRRSVPIRLGLHPVDADWASATDFWHKALAAVLAERPAAIKSELVRPSAVPDGMRSHA